MPVDLDTSSKEGARIRVIGIGGGGGNAINNMISKGLRNVDFIVANTDKQDLEKSLSDVKIQVGRELTRGLGTGASPEIGKKSVEESYDEIKDSLKGSDMLFVTAGMGGGTGTGGAPIISKIGQELGSLVVAIVTKPFDWEGKVRQSIAEKGIEELRQYVDALIVIPNQKLLDIIDKNKGLKESFQMVDEVLYNATCGIADIITKYGYINVDFADVRTIMKSQGDALMGIGTAIGENRAAEATQNALNSPLLDGTSISGAKGVLVNISGGSELSMHEVAEAVQIAQDATGSEVNLIHGVVMADEPKDEIMVTVVATGFNWNENDKKDKLKQQKFETNKPKLPFEIPQNTRKPITIGGATQDMTSSSIHSDNRSEIRKPTGDKELRFYNSPAVERNLSQESKVEMEKHLNKFDNVESNIPKNSPDKNPLIEESPTFFRRNIMD